MVRVTPDEFLAHVAALFDATVRPGRRGTIAVNCKSVPRSESSQSPGMLFRVVQYGNNHHKVKFSTMVTAGDTPGSFHQHLSHTLRTKVEVRANRGAAKPARTGGKGKKAAE